MKKVAIIFALFLISRTLLAQQGLKEFDRWASGGSMNESLYARSFEKSDTLLMTLARNGEFSQKEKTRQFVNVYKDKNGKVVFDPFGSKLSVLVTDIDFESFALLDEKFWYIPAVFCVKREDELRVYKLTRNNSKELTYESLFYQKVEDLKP